MLPKLLTSLLLLFAAVLPATNALAAAPACFGAAARDTLQRCSNPALTQAVVPSPVEARTLPNAACKAIRGQLNPPVCAFGTAAADATETIALVGDSHAGHWRAAVDEVARAKGWRGLSITHTSCPLQIALRDLPEPRRTLCAEWKQEVFAWFAVHPEVHTVFVAGLSGGTGVVPRPGLSAFASSVDGYRAAWDALPPTVQRIVVIRDTPKASSATGPCIQRALAKHRDAGRACAVPRERALDRDPAIAAAAQMAPGYVQTVDLTSYFCDTRDCYPVIGGGLVLRDINHMTGVFSATLGPYLLRAVDQVLPRFTA
jgi:hypothetical protein